MNLIEKLRADAVTSLFTIDSFSTAWEKWKPEIRKYAPTPTAKQIFDLSDNMHNIFKTTGDEGRSQSAVARSGACWESFVCWYLNLCLINSNTVVLKNLKELIPTSVYNAISVNYGSVSTNTESDLIAISFPKDIEYYNELGTFSVLIGKKNQELIKCNEDYSNYMDLINALFNNRDFAKLGIHIIQCKTNWNENSQIPMLWDIVYASSGFKNGVVIGKEGFSINQVKKFTYSFVTVPTTKNELKIDSLNVLRVRNLTGGNYWGKSSKNGIALSLKEMINHNFFSDNCFNNIEASIDELSETGKYSYFRFPLN